MEAYVGDRYMAPTEHTRGGSPLGAAPADQPVGLGRSSGASAPEVVGDKEVHVSTPTNPVLFPTL
jgi:hypothetical protein